MSGTPVKVSASLWSVDGVAQASSHLLCLLLCLSIDQCVVDVGPGGSLLDFSVETFAESCGGIVDSCEQSQHYRTYIASGMLTCCITCSVLNCKLQHSGVLQDRGLDYQDSRSEEIGPCLCAVTKQVVDNF